MCASPSLLEKARVSAMGVRAEGNCMCLCYPPLKCASVCAHEPIQIGVGTRVCNHHMKPSYHKMSVSGPHHTEAIIKVLCCTYVTQDPELHRSRVYPGWPGPDPDINSGKAG